MSNLLNISPIDGRYYSKTDTLRPYYSEFGLIKFRTLVEIEYLIALCDLEEVQVPAFTASQKDSLRSVSRNFTVENGNRIKEIERTTNHDVKAVEYFIKEQLTSLDLASYIEWVHFALTSQDINNTATPLSIKASMEEVMMTAFGSVVSNLKQISIDTADISMLARTHGQPASPTKLGKEIRVFHERLLTQLNLIYNMEYEGKFGGATGNFNAHLAAFPHVNWPKFADRFLSNQLGLKRQKTTTQIAHYDDLAALFHSLIRINSILIDLCRDIWTYISMEYFKQRLVEGEVGSSTMPHKVNPIDFENAEGNLGLANAIFSHLAQKLPVSRLQRDLTDSTVLRNVGVPMSHTLVALKSIDKGLSKLLVNETAISADLDGNWAVVTEAIQTILRRENFPKPYEALKSLSRGNNKITREVVHGFIQELAVSDKVKSELLAITPQNYTGDA